VQTGTGGLEIGSGSEIKCLAPCTDGNVYSNGNITGGNKTSSKISGSAWANGDITRIGTGGSAGVRVTKNAYASQLLHCQIDGDQSATTSSPGSGCPTALGRTFSQIPTPPPVINLPDFDNSYWEAQSTNPNIGGSEFSGDCYVLSGTATDCSDGGNLGPIKINGNLIVDNNTSFTITGPVWVTGDIVLSNNVIIQLDPSFGSLGTVMLADGRVIPSNNVTYSSSGSGRLLTVSKHVGDTGCTSDIAMSVSNNVFGAIFYALNGCVKMNNNAEYHGALSGQKIVLGNNTLVEYDPALSSAIFGATSEGGWAVTSWRELP
jgi:hypothetical protein